MQDLLPAGGLRLFREGVEPSGSLQKVSGYISILLLRPLPDANSIRLQEGSVMRHHGLRRARGCLLLGLPSVSPMRCWLRLEPRWYHLRPSRLHGIYYGAVPAWTAHRYFRPHGFATCAFSLIITDQGLKFRTKAQIRVTPPVHRTPHGQ